MEAGDTTGAISLLQVLPVTAVTMSQGAGHVALALWEDSHGARERSNAVSPCTVAYDKALGGLMGEDIKVIEVAWEPRGKGSSVIAATLLRLLFCWAPRVLGCSVGLPFACLTPESPKA